MTVLHSCIDMFSLPILFVSSCRTYRFIRLVISGVLAGLVLAACGTAVSVTPIFEGGRALLFASFFEPSVRIASLTAHRF